VSADLICFILHDHQWVSYTGPRALAKGTNTNVNAACEVTMVPTAIFGCGWCPCGSQKWQHSGVDRAVLGW